MFKHMLCYELGRSAHPFAAGTLVAAALALSARLKWFSLTDMPLFYLMFGAAAALMMLRFWRTNAGAEAEMLYAVPLSPAGQMAFRAAAVFVLSAASALVMLAALLLQGEAMGTLILSLSPGAALLLYLMIVWSMLSLTIRAAFAMLLSGLPPFRTRRLLWVFIWAAVVFVGGALLPHLTAGLLPQHIVLPLSGEILWSAQNNLPASFAFSLNELAWDAALLPVMLLLTVRLTRRYLLLA